MLFCEVKLVSADGVSLNGSTEMEMIDTLASKSGPKDVLRFLSKWVVGRQVSLQWVKMNDTTKILPSKEVKLIDSLCWLVNWKFGVGAGGLNSVPQKPESWLSSKQPDDIIENVMRKIEKLDAFTNGQIGSSKNEFANLEWTLCFCVLSTLGFWYNAWRVCWCGRRCKWRY